jgi:hypothetical protein
MQREPLECLLSYLQLGCLYIKHAVLAFQVKWYQSEVNYLDKRIAKLERELAELDGT